MSDPIFSRPCLVLADVGAVVRVSGGEPVRDSKRETEAGDNEVADDLDLRRGERAMPLVAGKHRGRELPGADGLLN